MKNKSFYILEPCLIIVSRKRFIKSNFSVLFENLRLILIPSLKNDKNENNRLLECD